MGIREVIWRLREIIWRLREVTWRLGKVTWGLKEVTWDLGDVIWGLRKVSGCPSGLNHGLSLFTMSLREVACGFKQVKSGLREL